MIFRKSYLLPLLVSPLGLLIPIAPRSGPLLVLLLGLAGIVHYIRHRPSLTWLNTPPTYFLSAFLLYLFSTSLWSITPDRSFEQAFRLLMLAFFGLAAFSFIRSLSVSQKHRAIECLIPALMIGVISGSVYGLLQYTSPYILPISEFLGIEPEFTSFHHNKLHIAKTMLVANLGFFALLPWVWQKQKLLAIAAFLAFFTVCLNADTQSSLVACLIGGMTFLLIKASHNWGAKTIATAIIMSFLIIVPVTQLPLMSFLHQTDKLDTLKRATSFDIRINLYRFFGGEVLNRPLLGHGLAAGVKLKAAGIEFKDIKEGIRSPHNIQLQTLFDIGYVGAVLMLLVIFSSLRQIFKDGKDPIMMLLLPLCVTIAATLFNFVIWRTWIPGATILCILFLFIYASKAQARDAR